MAEQSKAQIEPQSHSTPLSPNASTFKIVTRFLSILHQLQQGQTAILQDLRGLRQDVNGLRDEISRNSEKLDTLKSADPNSTIFEPFYGENGRQLASCIFQDSEVIKKLQGDDRNLLTSPVGSEVDRSASDGMTRFNKCYRQFLYDE